VPQCLAYAQQAFNHYLNTLPLSMDKSWAPPSPRVVELDAPMDWYSSSPSKRNSELINSLLGLPKVGDVG